MVGRWGKQVLRSIINKIYNYLIYIQLKYNAKIQFDYRLRYIIIYWLFFLYLHLLFYLLLVFAVAWAFVALVYCEAEFVFMRLLFGTLF